MTKTPARLAIGSGWFDINQISYIYGAFLYYVPFGCYAASAYLLYRKGMTLSAALLVLMYLILVYFTSYFIVGESHLSTGLFLLTCAVLVTCDTRKVTTLVALACLGAAAMWTYQFWVAFYPVCLVLFILGIRGSKTSLPIKTFHFLIIALYLFGFVMNARTLIFYRHPAMRNAMLTSHLLDYWPIPLIACLLFALTLFYIYLGSGIYRHPALDRWFKRAGQMASPRKAWAVAILALWAVSALAMLLLTFYDRGFLPPANHAYALRSMNLFLPLLFAATLLPARENQTAKGFKISARGISLCCVLPMLALTMQSSVLHSLGWRDYADKVYQATLHRTGYVSLDNLDLYQERQYRWSWTSPTMSIIMQVKAGEDVSCILYNPHADWQPFDPAQHARAARLVQRMGRRLLF